MRGRGDVHLVVPRLREHVIVGAHRHSQRCTVPTLLISHRRVIEIRGSVTHDGAPRAIQGRIIAGVDQLDDTLVRRERIWVRSPVVSWIDDDVELGNVVTHTVDFPRPQSNMGDEEPVDGKECPKEHKSACGKPEPCLRKRIPCQWTLWALSGLPWQASPLEINTHVNQTEE